MPLTAYLGGASPVLHLRDSRLCWGVGTERGWVNAGGGGCVQRVLAGCRYRACPIPGRGALLARTSGHAPVVLNDALRTSQDAHTAGEKISDTQVQPRVVTLAKTTAARQWLGGAAPVTLVAACRDARRACRDWFDSLAGAGKGRKGRVPPVPVPQGQPGLDPADPQRLGCRRRWGAGREGRRRPAGVLARSAVCAIWCHPHPGGRRPPLRILCRGGGRRAAAGEDQRRRSRPWPGQAGGPVYRGGHREPRASAPQGAGAGPDAEGTGKEDEGVEAGCQRGRAGCCPAP
jgi:hypothetical protein